MQDWKPKIYRQMLMAALPAVVITVISAPSITAADCGAGCNRKSAGHQLNFDLSRSKEIEFPYEDPVVLGQGWTNQWSKKAPATCIEFSTQTLEAVDESLDLSLLTDQESFLNSTKASVGAEVDGLFGSGGASASVTLATSSKVSSSSTDVLVQAVVDKGPTFVAPTGYAFTANEGQTLLSLYKAHGRSHSQAVYAFLKEQSGAIVLAEKYRKLAAEDAPEFLKECGDSYVSSINRGGRLFGHVAFLETSDDEKKSLSSSIKGSGAGFSFSASFENAMDSYEKKSRFVMKFVASGGTDVKLPTTTKELLEAVHSFSGEVNKAPKELTMRITPYAEVANWPVNPIAPAEPTNLQKIVSAYMRLAFVKSELDDAIADDGQHWVFAYDIDGTSLRDFRNGKILTALKEIQSLGTDCLTHPDCNIPDLSKYADREFLSRLPIRGTGPSGDIDFYWCGDPLPRVGQPRLPSAETVFTGFLDERFRSRVKAMDDARCSLYSECMSNEELSKLQSYISARMSKNENLLGYTKKCSPHFSKKPNSSDRN